MARPSTGPGGLRQHRYAAGPIRSTLQEGLTAHNRSPECGYRPAAHDQGRTRSVAPPPHGDESFDLVSLLGGSGRLELVQELLAERASDDLIDALVERPLPLPSTVAGEQEGVFLKA